MKTIYFTWIFVFMASLQGCLHEDLSSDVDFSVLHSSDFISDGTFTDKRIKILTGKNNYENELLKYSNDEAVSVNFSKSNILLVDMGQQRSGGFSIRVSSVKQDDDSITVTVISTRPSESCIVDSALTNPFQFVEISSKKKMFIEEKIVSKECEEVTDDQGKKSYSISSFTAQYYDNGIFVASEVVESPSINYSWSEFNNISSPSFSASWVGEITVPENEVQAIDINFSLSWSDVDLLINGTLVDAWSNSNKSINYEFLGGINIIEVRYKNNWHTVGFNTTFTTNEEYDFESAAPLIESLLTPEDTIIIYVGAYEASGTYSNINVTLNQNSTPIFLFLSSYDSVNWIIDNPSNVEIKGIVYGSYSPRSIVSTTTENSISLLEVDGLRYGYEGRKGNVSSIDVSGSPIYESENFSDPIVDIITLAGRAPDYIYGEYSLGDISVPDKSIVENNVDGVIVLDTFDDLSRNGGFVMSASKISGQQSVSMFDIDGKKSITKIKWSGSVNSNVDIDSAKFIIRLFKGDLRPDKDIYKELSVVSPANKVGVDDFNNYHFEFDLNGELILEQGRYWLSVVDPETEGLNFSWSIERNKLSTIYGSGGAFRTSDLSKWESPNNGIAMTNARGKSLLISAAEIE